MNDEDDESLPPSQRFRTFKEYLNYKARERDDWSAYDDEKIEDTGVPVTWDVIDQYSFPTDRWRIKNILPKEGFTILASVSGERKTWIALEMARCISHGENFLEKEEFATEGCNVLYLDCENSKSELQRRGRQLGFRADSTHSIRFFNDVDLNLNTLAGEMWLLKAIEYYESNVVFIDTLRAVAGGLKEDKAEDVRAFFNRYRVLKDRGVSMVFLDHVRKPSYFEKKIPQKEHLLGSQDKTASVEVLLMLKAENDSEIIELYQRKNRIAKEIEPLKIRMADSIGDDLEKQTRLTFEGFSVSKESQKEEAKRFVLEFLNDGGKTTNDILRFIGKEKKIGGRNIREALRELTESKEIDTSKAGRQNYYFLLKEEEIPINEEEVW